MHYNLLVIGFAPMYLVLWGDHAIELRASFAEIHGFGFVLIRLWCPPQVEDFGFGLCVPD
jgi:hypothetical protein